MFVTLVSLMAGCASDPSDLEIARQNGQPNVAPAKPISSATLRLESSRVQPMYPQMLTVDLESVERVAGLDNVGILEAQQRVEASQGRLEAAAASVLPVIGPGVALAHLQGVNTNAQGVLQLAHFTTLSSRRSDSLGREPWPSLFRRCRIEETPARSGGAATFGRHADGANRRPKILRSGIGASPRCCRPRGFGPSRGIAATRE